MAKVLYITANPGTVEKSFSLSVGQALIQEYRSLNPSDEVVELDLYSMTVPLIDRDVLTAWEALRGGQSFDSLTPAQQQKVGAINQLTDQFVGADKFVFVTPMWNLTIPPMMKAYIDTILVAGKTFKYTAEGPVGLMKGKKAVHVQARGGLYPNGPQSGEFGDSYLKAALGFIGLELLDSVIVEGMAYTPDKANEIKQAAIEKAKQAAKAL
ncbi:FMN-dependent NADH-azoreductase [Paenibacillus turpanensis]|uniref:FMN-dependent NADH-azoreductase n=1 Tax=Paenibacillus turpanensis TaxID=2689078 RepID=UPI00140DFAEF|nr:FMN-dependent NADH-azoreductase [Paenibacillus turpanensis]